MRVFVVEDSWLIRNKIIESIQATGGLDVVGFAETEQEENRAIQHERPDVIVTDISLREGSGIGVIQTVRALPTMRPLIVVLSNYSYPEYRQKCDAAGSDFFFDKIGEYHNFLELLKQIPILNAKAPV